MKKIPLILCLIFLSSCGNQEVPPTTPPNCEAARQVMDTYKECSKTSAVCAFRIERAQMVLRECS